jgi:hypothetical protein
MPYVDRTGVALDTIYPARRWGIESCAAWVWLLDSRRERLSILYTTRLVGSPSASLTSDLRYRRRSYREAG